MVRSLLVALKNALNEHLAAASGGSDAPVEQGPVVFLDSERADIIELKLGVVTLLLLNIEAERAMRPDDPYRRVTANGTVLQVAPPIYLNVYALFVARYRDYERSLRTISSILRYFQHIRVLDPQAYPELREQVSVELVTLPLAEQGHIWSLLRQPYQPSLLYRLRTAVYVDDEGVAAPTVIDPGLVVQR